MSYLKLFLMLIIFFNISCSQTVRNNGISNVKINEIKIEPGKTSKKNLVDKYGPPVFESVFNQNTVFIAYQGYITHRERNVSQVPLANNCL